MCLELKPVAQQPVVQVTTGPSAEIEQAEILKNKGIAAAVSKHAQVFFIAKNLALQLGKDKQYVHAGMVQDELKKLGYTSADLGNAAGALFSRKNWRDTGKTVKSKRLAAHRRKVTLWQYVGGPDTVDKVPLSVVKPVNVPVVTVTPVESTAQNTGVGTKINIKPELRDKLTGQGARPFSGVVIEVIDSTRWPLKVQFSNGSRGILAYGECKLA